MSITTPFPPTPTPYICGGAPMTPPPAGGAHRCKETTYKYVGCGGDFDTVRPRRDFTCLITSCCLLSLLLLIPLLCWLISGMGSTELYDCNPILGSSWSLEQQEYLGRIWVVRWEDGS